MNILLPAMGEGVIEATINKWLVAEGSLSGKMILLWKLQQTKLILKFLLL